MRAGLLRDVAVFKQPQKVASDTGAVRKEYVTVLRCRAYKKRLSNVTDKDKVDAKEVFYGHDAVIQVRYNPIIREEQIVEFRGALYKVAMLDRQTDNTLVINLNRINE